MSGTRVDVDLGQMSMPVGDSRRHALAIGRVDGAAVAHLQALMRRAPAPDWSAVPQTAVPVDVAGGAEHSANGLAPRDAEPLGTAASPAVGMPAGRLADELQGAMESLWVGDVTRGQRNVRLRLRLRREILPDTALHLFEDGGRLVVDMRVANEQVRQWLAGTLPALAATLGGRLARPLVITVAGVPPAGRSSHSVHWPDDVAAGQQALAAAPDAEGNQAGPA
ncbi:MAG: hypothetical protein ACRYGK_03545 [Janthinobacterium lividum]